MIKARVHTKDEACSLLLQQMAHLAHYWGTLESNVGIGCAIMTPLDRCNGLVFSILNIFDGGSGLPAINLVPSPHPSDASFNESEGKNWWPENEPINDDTSLHNLWKSYERT